MTLRDRQDQITGTDARALTDALNVHRTASNNQEARMALGIGDLALQDREFVDVRGGDVTFDELRIIKDATEGKEAVNLRTFNAMLRDAGFDPGVVLPFTDTGLPQVLTAEFRDLQYAEGPDSGTDVLLWSDTEGVHWGPPAIGNAGLNPDYLFGDINLVLYPFDVVFDDIPPGYLRFNDAAALSAFAANKVIFGNVNIWFRQDIAGTISIPNILPPFSARLIQGNSVSFNDTLVVNNTRVRLDCGTFDVPVPFNSPKLEFNDCVFDSRSFFAVRERGTASGNYIRLNRCRGRITVFGYPSASSGAELFEVNDSDLVLNVGSPHDNTFREQRYRRLNITRSDVLVANNVLFPGQYLDISHHLRATVADSVLATRVASVGTLSQYWIPEPEHSVVYNYQRVPVQWDIQRSAVVFSHLELNKEAWSSNSDATLPLGLTEPLVKASASSVLVLNASDRALQDLPGSFVYSPPLTPTNARVLTGSKGSSVLVGLNRNTLGDSIAVGFRIDRPALAAAHGAIGYEPLTVDSTSFGVLVDVGDTYTPTEAGVISVTAPVVEIRLPLTGTGL